MGLRKIILRIVVLLFFIQTPCFASCKISVNDSLLEKIISKGINYLSNSQIKTENVLGSYIGEWPTFIYNLKHIPFLGKKGKSAYDSNVFNTFFVHNTLAELQFKLNNPQIIPMLSLAHKNFNYYKTGCSFNFWPELPRPQNLKCKHVNCKQRRPANFKYHYGFVSNYSNIFDDSDDTAAGYLAYYYSNKIKDNTKTLELEYHKKEPFTTKFETFRDTGNRKTNWYNKKTGFNYRTGAYLTWFGPDRKNSNFFTWYFPHHNKQNILFGRNEVDCVVNANILRTLYITGDTNVLGIKESKEFLRKAVLKNKCFTCGVYYPTEFSFHYALAKAIDGGVTGLDNLKNTLVSQILEKKNELGFWNSEIIGNDIQSTLYAINSLLLLSPNKKTLSEIEPAINFVLSKMIDEKDLVHWNGGVFFSGGTAIRYDHVWVSDAYTTCLALEAMTNYLILRKQI